MMGNLAKGTGCPTILTRMDLEWRNLRDKIDYATRIPPSELFRRQEMATFEEEPLGAELIPPLGADSCMWASDYPHTDSTFPNSLQAIEEALGALSAEDRRKVLGCTASSSYSEAEPDESIE
jgi:predicted TIM-barrel fold metal-dependent hydrolase